MKVTRGCLPDAAPSTPRFPALARTAFACVLALAALATPALAQTGICGRTAVVQTFILAKIEGVSACADVTGTHLAAITGSLLLNSERITALAAGDFAGLTSLTNLYLNHNELTALPSGVFDGLTALRLLRLVENGLITLPAGVFDELTALRHLYLQDNALATLPSGVFAGLTALTDLTLFDNVLIALPADVFEPLTSLTILQLQRNDLATLPAGVFDALTALTDLQLHRNNLTTLPADVFEPLTSLTNRLYLDNNPGAPFAPVAVALPDDGTVSSAGGTVMLDGRGSDGGPWGEYVTYSWALTNPSSGVTVTFDDAGSATPVVTIPALAANTELTFTLTVAARSGSDGVTRGTDAARVTATTVPGAPTGLTATASGTTQIDLSWSAPASTGGSAITGYKIEVSPNGTSGWTDQVANTGNANTTYAHTGLASGDTRHYRVSAINANGAGTASNVDSATTASTNTAAMGAPTITGTAQVGQTLTAATTGITDADGLTSPTYTYQWIRVDGTDEADIAAANSSTYTLVDADLGTTIKVKVSFTDDASNSETLTSAATVTVTTTPGAPTGLAATANGPSQIDLAWSAPASTGGSAITGYKIESSSDGGSSWSDLVANTSNTTTTYAHTGLTAGTTRHYRVSAINANGTGVPSNVDSATTGTTVPGAPTGLTATASGTTQIDLAWSAPASTGGSAITGYKIESSSDGGSSWSDLVANTSNTTTTYAHTGLTAGTTRHYRVSAINANGAGTASNVDSATTGTTVPGAPTGLSATASGTTQIDLAWSAPASTGGSAITGYKIEVSANGTSGWTDQVANTNSTATTYAHTGLAAGDTRHYRVSAINANGAGTASNVDSATTGTTVPGAPTGLSATASGTTQIDLAWSAPASTGGSAITGYKIEVSANGTSGWTDQVANTNSTATTYAHTGLAAGDTRHYRVSAINANGAGTASNVDSATTGTTVPGAPTGLTATASGTTSRSTSGLERPGLAPAAPPSPATRSRSGAPRPAPAAPPSPAQDRGLGQRDLLAGPTRSPTPTAPPPPTPTPGLPPATPATTASPPSTPTAPAPPPTSTAPPPAPPCPALRPGSRPRPAGPPDIAAAIDLDLERPGNSESTGGSAITGYKIEVSPDGSSWSDLVADTGSTDTAYAHVGLAPATTRHYRVSAINAVGTSDASDSDDTTTTASTNTAAMGAPTITGTAQVGQTLTAATTGITDADGLTSPTYTYQWIRVDGTDEADIAAANSSTYTLVDADLGTTIKVKVSFTDDASHTETLTSAATATVGAVATGPPTVTEVAVTSTPASGTTYYLADEVIEFTVTFSAPVTVTATPKFAFRLGAATRQAAYASGSDSAALVFARTVQAGEVDRNGISWNALALALDGGTITQTGATTAARLTHAAQAPLAGHRVDAAPPMQVSASVQGLALVLVYDEPLDPASMPATGAYTVTATVGATATNPAVSEVSIYGIWVTLTLDAAPAAGATVTLAYAPPASNPVQDEAGNDAPAFSGQSVRLGPPPPPSEPLEQVLGVGVAPGNAQLVVTWTAVDTATGYTVQWTSGGQGYNTTNRQATVTSGTTTSHTITGLANGTEYTVQVSATRTGVTDGPPSEEMTGTPRVPPPPPPPVTDLAQVLGVGVVPGNAQLVVTWTAVDTATGYTVQWMSGSQGYNPGDRQAPVTSGSTTRYTIPSLTNGTAYTVRVIATRTGATDGPPSAEETGTPRVPPPPPPPPRPNLAQVLGVGVVPGNAQLVVTWTAVDTATGYTVQWTSGSQGYNTGDRQAPVTSGSTTRYTIPSLINGTAYTVRVIATRTGATDGPPSADVTATPVTTPAAPQHLRGEPGDAQVTLTWAAPASDGGSAILRYEYAVDDSGTWIDAGGDLEETVRDLTNGQSYAVAVRAVTAAGAGPAATVTSVPADPRPQAWLARFGRTATDHVVDAVSSRWHGGPQASHLTLGGPQAEALLGWTGLGGQAARDTAADRGDSVRTERASPRLLAPSGGAWPGVGGTGPGMTVAVTNRTTAPGGLGGVDRHAGAPLRGRAAPRALLDAWGLPDPRALTDLRAALMGSSFLYAGAQDDDGQTRTPGWLGAWSAWGRGAASWFSGADGGASLEGEVATAMLGFDSRWGRWRAGVVASHSRGQGTYTPPTAPGGAVASTLTALHPYAGYDVNARTSVWGVVGYGVGEVSLTPARATTARETDLTNTMAAVGGRTALSVRSGRAGRFELALRSDARLTNTAADAVAGLVGATERTRLVRMMLEGAGVVPLALGGVLTPTVEAGLRYDTGDAETGAGLEVGGGLGYAVRRLSVTVNARGLLAHQDTAYEEWGFSGALTYTPSADGRGLSMRLGSGWGATHSGVESLWSRQNAAALVRHAPVDAAQAYQLEVRYGLDWRQGRARWAPYLGVASGGGSRQALRLGVTLTAGRRLDAGLELGQRQGAPGADPEHAAQLRATLRW